MAIARGSGGYGPPATYSAPVLNSLVFPNNTTGAANNLPYTVIEFDRPDLDGLPMWGPSGQGITIIRRVKVTQQPGYYAQVWMTRSDGTFDGICWGAHPYPVGGGNTATTHQWEVAGGGNDHLNNRDGGSVGVTKDRWYTQAIRVNRVNSGQKFVTLMADLPSTANADIIDSGDLFSIGESTITTLKLIIGDSPWFASFQNERFGGHLGQIKIIAKLMSEADCVTEASNMSALVTADAIANIWWGKKGFTATNDLTCDYGTGRSFTRVDPSSLLTLGSLS